jgi:hypothetical protein
MAIKQVDGIGIANETVVIWPATKVNEFGEEVPSETDVVFLCCAASPEAIVYVNGYALQFDEEFNVDYLSSTPSVTSWNNNVMELRHNDRLCIGHCAYVFLIVSPAEQSVQEVGRCLYVYVY